VGGGTRRQQAVHVLVAERHPVVLRGIEAILGEDTSLQIVARRTLGRDAAAEIAEERPDVLVMPAGTEAVETVRQVREQLPGTRVVMVVAVEDDEVANQEIVQAVPAGVSAFVTKEDEASGLIEAVHRAAQGLPYVSPAVLRRLVDAELHGHLGA
jgi:DNA-binding NarL/FixJ family response regulator